MEPAGALLRGAAAHEGDRRHLHHRRFRPPARQPRAAAEPLARADAEPLRLSEAAQRQELLDSVRRAADIFYTHGPAGPEGPGLTAPHPLQAENDIGRESCWERVLQFD